MQGWDNWNLQTFSPMPAVIGGCLIGAASMTMLISSGRTMGFSGITKGLWSGNDWKWKAAFIASLISASGLSRLAYPALHEPIAPSNLIRVIAGGMAVGLGSGMANGCTSGHGIVGVSRFSTRSIVATATFMTTAVLTATLTRLSDAYPIPVSPILTHEAAQDFGVVGLTMIGFFAALFSFTSNEKSPVYSLINVACGACAGLGLHLGGMSRPSKIASFLDLSHGFSGRWDPSLIFVMAGAHLVAMPVYHAYIKGVWQEGKGTSLRGMKFGLPPTNGKVDAKLVVGAALFGAGWGLSALCPGPAHAGVMSIDSTAEFTQIATFHLMMALGWWLQPRVWP
jgi:uncharacterized membrane protein YedE/YeeE